MAKEFIMNKKIQPKYQGAKVKCSTCGSEYEIGSTLKEIKIDTCSNCHPFYTGKQSFVQATGAVEKFNKKYGIKHNEEE
jgi:large subunit ribosomal protein L31